METKNRFNSFIKKIKNNRKKGFTLLESIISIALFAIAGVILTMFVISSNKMLVQGYEIANNKNQLRESIDTGKTNKPFGIYNNRDDADEPTIEGGCNIKYSDIVVYGPNKNNNDEISTWTPNENKIKDESAKINVITATKKEVEGGRTKEIAQLVKGELK